MPIQKRFDEPAWKNYLKRLKSELSDAENKYKERDTDSNAATLSAAENAYAIAKEDYENERSKYANG